MNDELTKLFDKFPEAIVIFNPETKQISLVNSEFKRLFKIENIPINDNNNEL